MRRLSAAAIVIGLLLTLTPCITALRASGAAMTSSETVAGEGESWPQQALFKLENDAGGAVFGNYTPTYLGVNAIGEDGARQDFASGLTDFDVTEAPLSAAEIATAQQNGITPGYVPYGLGAVDFVAAISYEDQNGQHHLVSGLQLTMATLARIYDGQIEFWDDPEIIGENPTLAPILESLSNSSISVSIVQRTDSSATTSAMLAAFRASPTASKWNLAGTAATGIPRDSWPPTGATNIRGISDGLQLICDDILNVNPNTGMPSSLPDNSIAYMSPQWAAQFGIPEIAIQNRAGNFELPTPQTITDAFSSGSTFDSSTGLYSISEDFDYSKITASDAYPIPLASYLVMPETGASAGKAGPLSKFAQFALSAQGQADVAAEGMVPVTSAAVTSGMAVAQAVAASGTTTTTATSTTTSTTTALGGGSSLTTSAPTSTTVAPAAGASDTAGATTTTTAPATAVSGGPSGAAASSAGTAGSGSDPGQQLPATGSGPAGLLVAGIGVLLVLGGTAARRRTGVGGS